MVKKRVALNPSSKSRTQSSSRSSLDTNSLTRKSSHFSKKGDQQSSKSMKSFGSKLFSFVTTTSTASSSSAALATASTTASSAFSRSYSKPLSSIVRRWKPLQTVAFRSHSSNSSCSNGGSSSSLSDRVDRDQKQSSSKYSARGQQAVDLLPTYLADARSVIPYCPKTAPQGALQLGVAESKMLEDWLVPALQDAPPISADAIYYQPTAGRAEFRVTMASYMEDLLQLSHKFIDPEGVVVGAGCNAVLENLCFCLAQAGDAVLIPRPYYAAFEFDLTARAGLYVHPISTFEYQRENEGNPLARYYPNRASLDAAYEEAQKLGHPPRILLLSHPQNPLGICYPPNVIKECIDWCNENEVHLISDEIYAGSVYRPGEANFQSVLKVLDDGNEGLGDYVHWVYALSKDFALSGLRVGVLYTENKDIRTPLSKLNDLCQMSSQTQLWTQHTLNKKQTEANESWVQAFRTVNHKRLRERCDRLQSVLDECSIDYVRGTAGLFLWIDLRPYLSGSERELYLKLTNQYGLLLTPGESMRSEDAGFFRCVFTAATDDEFYLALERFRTFSQTEERLSNY